MSEILNETLYTIEKRKSTRAFADIPITPQEKEIILHAAFRAPTAGNMMLYTVIEVEDQAIKDHLAVTCDNQPFIAKAPYVLLFLADFQRWVDYYALSGVKERCAELGLRYREPQVGDFLEGVIDAVIAAQNAVIAAESLGIGSCYIGDIIENYEDHRRLFSLPRYVFPAALLCFGRPNREHTPETQVARFDPEFITHKNTYHRLDAAGLERMMQPRQDKISTGRYLEGAQNLGQHEYFRKFNADFSYEMSRSVREALKNWDCE